MKYTLKIDKTREEEIQIFAHEKTPLIEKIEDIVNGTDSKSYVIGYRDTDIVNLSAEDIYCFFIEGGKLFALTENEKLHIKARLYEIEERLPKNFVKINQSSIANLKYVERFSVSIGASLTVHFKNGYTDYVSRRQVKFVKERLTNPT